MARKRKRAAPKTKPKTRAAVRQSTDEPAPKRPRVEGFNFSTEEVDPIIENLREVSRTYEQHISLDDEILTQVALEGLTGLTFGRLCLILDAVIPNLNSAQDGEAQDYIWSVIVNRYMRRIPGASIQVFHLDPPTVKTECTTKRADDTHNNLSASQTPTEQPGKSFIIDKEIKLPSHTLTRIAKSDWMLHPVQDGATMGSCAHYTHRTNITQAVLKLSKSKGPHESLQEIDRKFNLKQVYLVADQELRRRMLLPANFDPNMDLKLREFACLELIGRTRCLGIVFPNDKALGRYRILLTAKGLITQYQQTCNSYIVLHIRRFSQYNLELGGKPFKNGQLTTVKVAPNVRDDDDDVYDTNEMPSVKTACCHPRRLKSDQDMLKMVYDLIALSKGRSMLDIRRKLKIPKSHVRNHLKNLANIELIGSHTRRINEKKFRIYRARHKSNRCKTAAKKVLNGVRARWDDIDIRAKELLGFRRSHFSQAEDSLLILCRITCLLLEPSLKKLSFCVPKHLIRDTLHDELYESHDKTADSLLRRTKFLRHLPQNILMVNELTAELRDDSDVVRLVKTRRDANSEEKLGKLFRQLLRVVRAKLPHLLGLTSSLIESSNRTINIENSADLRSKFELVDCQMPAASITSVSGRRSRDVGMSSSPTMPVLSSALLSAANVSNKSHQPPASTLIQLAQPIDQEIGLDLAECKGMKSILFLASYCANSSFDINLHLKVPVRVVGLDQDNENFKDIFERAKESKETSRIIANLTTPNPTADSRRALFMLRNALKLQTLDKCGKLADALIVQPCDIKFTSNKKIIYDDRHLLEELTVKVSEILNDSIALEEASQKGPTRRTSKRRRTMNNKKERPSAAQDQEQKQQPEQEQQYQQQQQQQQRDRAAQGMDVVDSGVASGNERVPGLSIDTKQVLKSIESLLSWITIYPGIEFEVLQAKMARHLIGSDSRHLAALLDFMEGLQLISSARLDTAESSPEDGGVESFSYQEPRLFGYKRKRVDKDGDAEDGARFIRTYEPQANVYIKYCQLINIGV